MFKYYEDRPLPGRVLTALGVLVEMSGSGRDDLSVGASQGLPSSASIFALSHQSRALRTEESLNTSNARRFVDSCRVREPS